MAKYVLVEFDDDATADEFIKRIHRASKVKAFRLKGIFKKPTAFCACGPLNSTALLARGPKTGWFIHVDCGLPRGRSQAPRNLLPDLLDRARRKETNSQRIATATSLMLQEPDGEPLRNFPIQEGPREP